MSTSLNQRDFVNGKEIIVTLVRDGTEASITVGAPGNPSDPENVSIQPLLDAGLTAREALQHVLQVASIAVRGATKL